MAVLLFIQACPAQGRPYSAATASSPRPPAHRPRRAYRMCRWPT